jgi:hypothetical protein
VAESSNATLGILALPLNGRFVTSLDRTAVENSTACSTSEIIENRVDYRDNTDFVRREFRESCDFRESRDSEMCALSSAELELAFPNLEGFNLGFESRRRDS